jgi:RNA polymerase sigma-70 factor (ECF subfamily)
VDEVASWVREERGGRADARGRALEASRWYLEAVARREMSPELRSKLGASDLVQETLLAAHRDLAAFRGGTDREWRAWLRSILRHALGNARRHFQGTSKRRIDRERSMAEATHWPDDAPTPRTVAENGEFEQALLAAMDRLPPRYRDAIAWRHREGVSFEEIGRRLEVSPEAARKVWTRGLLRLRDELGTAGS